MTKGRGPKRPVTKHGGGWFKLLFGDHKPAGRGPAGTGTAGVTGSTVANLRQGLEASTVALGLLLWQAPCLVLEFGALKGMPSLRLAAAVRTSRPVKQRIANNKAHDPPPSFCGISPNDGARTRNHALVLSYRPPLPVEVGMATSIVSYLLEFTNIWRLLEGNFFSPACRATVTGFSTGLSYVYLKRGDLRRGPSTGTCELYL